MGQQGLPGKITDSELIAFANECARYYRIPVVFVGKTFKEYGDVRLTYKLRRDAEYSFTEKQLSGLIGYICQQTQQNLRLEKLSGFTDPIRADVKFQHCKDCGIPLFTPADDAQCFRCSLTDKFAPEMQVDLSAEDAAEHTSMFGTTEDVVEHTGVFDAPNVSVDTSKLFGRYAAVSTIRGKIQVDRVKCAEGVQVTLMHLGEPYYSIVVSDTSSLQDEFAIQLSSEGLEEHITLKRCLKRYT